MSPEHLRNYILQAHPESRLEPLSNDQLEAICSARPWLPRTYLEFLRFIGAGCIGDSRYAIYHGPVEPDFIFDQETAQGLGNVVLLGDDFAGTHEAYLWSDGIAIFGSIDASHPKFEAHTDSGMLEFIAKWHGSAS